MRLSAPINAQIELTERCNVRCFHCYNYWRNQDDPPAIQECSVDEFLRIVSLLDSHGVKDIVITGGEPLLRWETLLAIARHAHSLHMYASINTNAALMTTERAQALREAGIRSALVSLTGSAPIHTVITNSATSYQQTVAGIQHLIAAGIPVAVNMVVSRWNQQEIFSTAAFVASLGVKTFCASPMVPAHPDHEEAALSTEEIKQMLRELMRAERELHVTVSGLQPFPRCMFTADEDDEFIQFMGNRICSAGITSCAISPNGDFRPCPHADISYGNLLCDDFTQIWNAMDYWSSAGILPEQCRSCNANVVCEGGCRMAAKICNGQYDSPDPRMTEPIQDLARIAKLTSSSQPMPISVESGDQFGFYPGTHFRVETFGGIIVSAQGNAWLNHQGFAALRVLHERGIFSYDEFVQLQPMSEAEALQALGTLIHKGVVQRIIKEVM